MDIRVERGFPRRMRVYLAEMYPPGSRLGTAALFYLAFTAVLGRIHGRSVPLLSAWTAIGIWDVFALLLILRLMDELKDREIDRRLFFERPLPSRRVREGDIVFSLALMNILFLAANIAAGPAFWTAAGVLAYAWLMFRYFFIPGVLRRNLLLNLATHNPFIPLLLLHLIVLFAAQADLPLRAVRWQPALLLAATFWPMSFGWEISRKIRSREEENEYVTYSRILSRPGAVALAAGAQSLTLVLAVDFFRSFSMPGVLFVPAAAGYALAIWGHARFLLNPSPRTSRLKTFAQIYIVGVLAALLAGALLSG
jgi:4-hydroxybenzoate polyprenyltransferase